MKILGLLRHAKSDWGASDKRDFDRGVNARGCRGATLIGEHIAARGIAWDAVLASPARRVRITLAEALPDQTPRFDDRLYLASAETIVDILQGLDDGDDAVLVAGHNPGLGDMLFEIVAPANENALYEEAKVKFPTASFALFELDIDRWADLKDGCGRIVDFARPRDFDPELGPED